MDLVKLHLSCGVVCLVCHSQSICDAPSVQVSLGVFVTFSQIIVEGDGTGTDGWLGERDRCQTSMTSTVGVINFVAAVAGMLRIDEGEEGGKQR